MAPHFQTAQFLSSSGNPVYSFVFNGFISDPNAAMNVTNGNGMNKQSV